MASESPTQSDPAISDPSDWVVRFIPGVAKGGTVLDLACGGGRHLRLARDRGHPVVGIDRNLDGVADLAGAADVRLIAADLEDGSPFPVSGETFAGIIVTNYLFRPLFADIGKALAADGVLIYETFARGHERFRRPSNPDFLLRPNELIEAFAPALTIIAFEQGETVAGRGRKIVQRICAVGWKHDWAETRPAKIE